MPQVQRNLIPVRHKRATSFHDKDANPLALGMRIDFGSPKICEEGSRMAGFDSLPLHTDLPHPVSRWSSFIAMAQSREPMFRFVLNGDVALWLNDAELMRTTLMAPFAQVGLGPLIKGFEKAGGLGNAITVNFSQTWRARRRVLQRPLTHRGVRALGLVIENSLRTQVSSWQPTTDFPVGEVLTDMILDVIGVTLVSGDHQEFRQVIHEFDRERNTAFVAISQDPDFEPAGNPAFTQSLDALNAFIFDVITERRKSPRNDLLSHIVTASTVDGDPLSDAELRDEVVGLIYAGHKTTANSLVFALWLLATHGEIQSDLAAQTAALVGGPPFHEIFEERAPLASQVVAESLRLYPVGDLIDRTVAGDFVLAGVELPVGLPILFSTWIPQRDVGTFQEPNEFQPSRCRPGALDPAQRAAYLPFSTGPKVCLGVHLASYEAAMALAIISQQWVVGTPAGVPTESLMVHHDPLLFADPTLRLTLAKRTETQASTCDVEAS